MRRQALRLVVGGELIFRLEGLHPELARRMREAFAAFIADNGEPASKELAVDGAAPPPEAAGQRVLLLSQPPVRVWRTGPLIEFDVPGATAWCEPGHGRGGLALRNTKPQSLDALVGLVAAPLLMELAAPRGWLGLHAAGVACEDRGILMPAPSGFGKSTIFRNAAAAGLDVLSDDLIWVHETGGGFRMWAFPRFAGRQSAPRHTIDNVAVTAIVCPVIVNRPRNALQRLTPAETLNALTAQSGFLTAGSETTARFRALVRLAAIPAWRLEAGMKQQEVPHLLRRVTSWAGTVAVGQRCIASDALIATAADTHPTP